ncbi:polysaccharide deacetylase family protein [bacterium]|nr:polysaccharide deacetylase family protein [bacterium]
MRRSIPVITYHHVNCHLGDTVTVTPEYFEEQMRYLGQRGYNTIFLKELISCLEQKKAPPEKTVALTFDDGYLDNWLYAYPILKKYKMKATIFVITSPIRDRHSNSTPEISPHSETRPAAVLGKGLSDHYLSWAEMREMEDSGLVDIQCHTHSHQRLDSPEVDCHNELSLSKKLIDEHLKKDCSFIAWPWGTCNEEVIALARQLGYRGAVITKKGPNTPASDPMKIRRFDTEKGNLGWFSRRLFIYSHPTIARVYSALKSEL